MAALDKKAIQSLLALAFKDADHMALLIPDGRIFIGPDQESIQESLHLDEESECAMDRIGDLCQTTLDRLIDQAIEHAAADPGESLERLQTILFKNCLRLQTAIDEIDRFAPFEVEP